MRKRTRQKEECQGRRIERFEAVRTSSLCTACVCRHKCSHLRKTKIDRHMKKEKRSKEGEGEDREKRGGLRRQ